MPIEGFKRKFCSRSYLPKNDLTFFLFSRICYETLVGAVLLSKKKKRSPFIISSSRGFVLRLVLLSLSFIFHGYELN